MTACRTCSAPLSRRILQKLAAGRQITGLCASCWRASVRVERHCVDCGAKVSKNSAARCRACGNARLAADPAFEARRLELMREALKVPEIRERRANGIRRATARKMAWLPQHHRDEYFRILNRLGRAQLARAAIRERMTPFERQISLVMEGKAQVVEKFVVPMREPEFTLAGVSAGLLG
jgi:hypothetical protein